MAEETTGVRTRQRVATLYAIERVALGMFVDRGFDSVTAEQIAEAAGISVRTFYRHFPEGKEGVVLLEARRGGDLFRDALIRRPPHEAAMVALRHAAIDSVLRIDDVDVPVASFGVEESQQVLRQITEGNAPLLARLFGERVLMLESLVALVALRMSVDPTVDVRPRLFVHAVHAAITASWLTSQANPELAVVDVLAQALDVLEAGLDPRAAPPSTVGQQGRRDASAAM
ncbi:MAG: TetR family transcriptional regulator [Acidimicrobiia bacterium]